MNSDRFLADQKTYFATAYDQFRAFGGPCVYFHRECLLAGQQQFASPRHIEMIYATLTAWGMHRMGNVDRTKTKLTDWEPFSQSLQACASKLAPLRGLTLLDTSEREYDDAVESLWPAYRALRLSASGATVVVNAKALYHLLPGLVPPIDRQYTIRFFTNHDPARPRRPLAAYVGHAGLSPVAGSVDLVWSDDALADLDRFAAFLHDHSPELAANVAQEIVAKAQVLSRHPNWAAHARPVRSTGSSCSTCRAPHTFSSTGTTAIGS